MEGGFSSVQLRLDPFQHRKKPGQNLIVLSEDSFEVLDLGVPGAILGIPRTRQLTSQPAKGYVRQDGEQRPESTRLERPPPSVIRDDSRDRRDL